MKLLLDTHIVLWSLADSARLSSKARELLLDDENEFWVSSASVWEIAIKVILGKHHLRFPLRELETAIYEAGYQHLELTYRHALAIERVGVRHADPFDRLLLAQCEVETLQLMTADRLLASLSRVISV